MHSSLDPEKTKTSSHGCLQGSGWDIPCRKSLHTQSRLITDLLCSALQLPVRPTSPVVLYRIDPDRLVSIRKVVVSVDFANYEIYERERYLGFPEQ